LVGKGHNLAPQNGLIGTPLASYESQTGLILTDWMDNFRRL
jgi:hypothetical protein